MRKECRSLNHVPPGEITLNLRFDGDPKAAVKDVLFRVLPEAWPVACSETLPIVHVGTKVGTKSVGVNTSIEKREGQREKTWDDLKREGAMLGVQGWTDRVKAGL